jgi:hypothetical protein
MSPTDSDGSLSKVVSYARHPDDFHDRHDASCSYPTRSYDRNQGKEKEQRNVNVGGSSWMVYMVSEVNAVSR